MQKKEARHLDESQAGYLLSCLEEEPLKYQLMICIDLVTGMRRGELMALEWKDINTEDTTIRVTKSLEYVPGQGQQIKPPKTESSKRIVSFPKSLVPLILEYKLSQNKDKVEAGQLWNAGDWVFTRWDGQLMHVDTVSKWFPKFIKKHNLKSVNFHAIRHTAATLLINQGLKQYHHVLGHANASTTLNIYSHALQTADQRAAELMKDFVMPKNKNNKDEVKKA